MLIEVAVLSVSLASSCSRRGPGEHFLSLGSNAPFICTVAGSSEPSLLYSKTIEEALATDLSAVPEVSMVFVERADDNLLVWIAVDNPASEVRERVFQKQYDLIEGFPEISFDFNLVSSRGRKPDEFASRSKQVYSREG